jgi:hypothetical protein
VRHIIRTANTTSRESSKASFEVRHIRRTANTAAHQLAKEALELSLDVVWMEECPSFILNIVIAEKVSF